MVIGVEGMATISGLVPCDTLLRPTAALRRWSWSSKSNIAFFRRLPAVAAAAHPVVALRSATRPIP